MRSSRVGLTLVYGVLHIINFAHGAILSAAMFAAFFAYQAGLDPYRGDGSARRRCSSRSATALQRLVIGPASHGEDRNMLLVTLGLVDRHRERAARTPSRADTRTIDTPYGFSTLDLGLRVPRVPGRSASASPASSALALWAAHAMTDTGKAIRAVAKEKLGAALVGIDVAHIYAVTFGLGAACLAVAACLLLPIYYVNPARRRGLSC